MDKISIIIPCYNCEKTIFDTLQSICNQNYSNLEIIIVDDGSTDNTKKIVCEFIKQYKNIIYIFQENAGAPTARNKGISVATGKYVVFFDADDIMKDNAINIMADNIKKNKSDLLIGNYEKIDNLGVCISKQLLNDEFKVISEKDRFCYSSIDPKPGNKMYSLDIIKNNNLIFDDLKIGQDLNFFLKYLIYATTIVLIPEVVYGYRIVDGSISRTYTKKILSITDTFNKVKEFYKINGFSEEYNKYICIVEYINYYYQYCKVRFFVEKEERKDIYKYFKKISRKVKLNKSTVLYKKEKNRCIKFKFRLLIGRVFISNLYCKFFKILKGGKHI
ncbi:MAG TPA: hypothetical protein DCZ30_00045 [Clostridiales bacterium]|nr:hypothetical protein [Clostridiales bacterium]